MFKKLSFLFFCFSIFTFSSAQTFAFNGVNYNITSATTVEVGSNASFMGSLSLPLSVSNGGTSYAVNSIANNAFNSSQLTSVSIPDTVTSIGGGSFANCTRLTSITIPNSVTSIGGFAFGLCTALTSVICSSATPLVINSSVFASVSQSRCSLIVPTSSVSAYQAAAVWQNFNPIIGDTTLNTSELNSKNNLILYPNPIHNEAFLELKNSESSKLEVCDMNGKMVLRKSLNNNSKNTVNTNNLPNGIYLFKVGKSVTKVVKN